VPGDWSTIEDCTMRSPSIRTAVTLPWIPLERNVSGPDFIRVQSNFAFRRHVERSFNFKWKIDAFVHRAFLLDSAARDHDRQILQGSARIGEHIYWFRRSDMVFEAIAISAESIRITNDLT